jgi:protein-disulfide isomerase
MFYLFWWLRMTQKIPTSHVTLIVVNTLILVGVVVYAIAGWFQKSSQVSPEDIKQIVAEAIQAMEPAPQPQQQPEQPPANAPTPAEIQAFIDGAYVSWPEDAQVTIIEFSDFECPFCKRFNDAGTLDAIVAKYPWKVNKVFTHFPLSFHPLAQKAAEWAECVWAQWGSDAYYEFKKNLFAEAKPDTAAIMKVAGAISWVDAAEVERCLNDGQFAQKVQQAMAFGARLTVTGTPWNILFNRANGSFVKVSWAVPAEAFDAQLMWMIQ